MAGPPSFGLACQQAIAALIAETIITRSMMTLMPVPPLAQAPQTALRPVEHPDLSGVLTHFCYRGRLAIARTTTTA